MQSSAASLSERFSKKLRELKNGLKGKNEFSLENIGDIAVIMESKKKLKKMRWMMLLTGTPVTAIARKLTRTSCGHKGFCAEVWGGDDK